MASYMDVGLSSPVDQCRPVEEKRDRNVLLALPINGSKFGLSNYPCCTIEMAQTSTLHTLNFPESSTKKDHSDFHCS